jgi:DNA-binding transcriptional LysR family regulator
MLDLRRLRLLYELHARGTIAAVADALQFTPSAVSQQLAVLEREAGVPLLEPSGRSVRLTDAALVLVRHAGPLLERAELAQAELAAAAGRVAGRGRIASFQSTALKLAVPAMQALAREAPALRCELVEAEPEESLPALALGDVDLVLADEWQHQPLPRPEGVAREDLHLDPVRLVLPEKHPAALGGFNPDLRHRTNDSVTSLALVAGGRAVTLLPELVGIEAHPGVAVRDPAEGSLHRTIFMASRAADAERPSVRALRSAVRAAAAELGWSLAD